MEDFSDLQRLLRLKRHEAPPADAIEDFLLELHQRQRAELLRRSTWQLLRDRIEGALSLGQVSRYAYAGSCAAALAVAGVASMRIMNAPAGVELAAASGSRRTVWSSAAPVAVKAASIPDADFYSKNPSFRLSELDFDYPRAAKAGVATAAPRYVLDSHPVSYGQPYSF